MRKLILIFFREFARKYDDKIIGPTILIVLIIFYVINSFIKPYEKEIMTHLENASIFITIITVLSIIIMNEYTEINEYFKIFANVII